MREKTLAFVAVLSLALSSQAQITGPTERSVGIDERNVKLDFVVVADSADYVVIGTKSPEIIREPTSDPTHLRLAVSIRKEGDEGHIVLFAVKGGKLLPIHVCRVWVPGVKPPPTPGPTPTPIPPPDPRPPDPKPPDPKPPDPKPPDPSPTPAPIPVAGLRVLIVYESAEVDKLNAGQRGIIFGKSIRESLDAKCIVGPDGKTKEWRIFDKDVDASADSKLWADAMKRKRDSVPWLLISNGVTGWEGPLPATAGEFMNLVERYEK